jgi:hypothetical protein
MIALIISNPISEEEDFYKCQIDELEPENKHSNSLFHFPQKRNAVERLFKSKATLGMMKKYSRIAKY